MAIVKNDPFPGTDYSTWQSWKKITLPDGQVLYEVPGNPGYAYDPIASNATGRKVFRKNPQLQVDEYNQRQEAIKQQQFNQSPLGQIVPVAAGTGGIIAASKFTAPGATAIKEVGNGILMSDGTIKPIGDAIASNVGAAAQATNTGAQIASGEAPNILSASRVTGETPAPGMFSPGTIGGNALGAAGLALGGYEAFKGVESGNPLQAGLGGAGVGFGLNSLGYALGPWGWAAALAAPTILSFLNKHETTREVAKKHTSQLLKQSDDPAYQGYVQAMRQQHNAPPPDPTKPFHAGKYGTWEEYKSAGLDPNDLTGVYGNIKTFGPEWANLTQAQRVAVTKGIIDAGLYNSRKGEVEISDATKAKEIKDNVLKGFGVGAQTGVQAGAQAAAQAAVAARSSTRSPGIGMNGQRINFGR